MCWTLSSLSFTSAGRRVGSLSVNLIRLVMALVFFTVHGAIFHGQPFPEQAPASSWLWLSISGFTGFFLCDLCLFKAFVLIGPRLSTLLLSLSPPLAALLAIPILGETIGAASWLGMAVTLAGVSWVVLERRVQENGAHPHDYRRGIALGILASLAESFALVLSKLGMGDLKCDPFAAAQIRVLPAVAGFAVLLCILRWYPRVVATLKQPKVMGWIAFGSLTGPYLGVSLLLLALQYTSTGVARTIVALIPVMIIPFVVVLYRERVNWRAILGTILAVGGVAILLLWK